MGALTVGSDGDYFKVTGTTDIDELASKGKGTQIWLEFEDILTITHHATDLVLPNSEDITTYSGLVLAFREYDTAKWRLVGGAIVPHDHSGEEGGGEVTGAGEAIRDSYRGLVIKNTVGQEDAQVDVNIDEIVIHNLSGVAERLTDVDLTIDNANGAGINKLDTGSVEVSKWYYIWVVKGDTGNGGLLSLSSSLATILGNAPAGYNDSAALLGVIRTDATYDFLITYQIGNRVRCKSGDFTASGVSAASVNISAYIPDTAKFVYFTANSGGETAILRIHPVTFVVAAGNTWFELLSSSAVNTTGDCPIETAHTIFTAVGAGANFTVNIHGWGY